MKTFLKHILTLLAAAGAFAATLQASQEQLAASIKDARTEAQNAEVQLKTTVDALNALNELAREKKGDIKAAYQVFAAELPKTEAAANWARTRLQWMTGDGQKYFDTWQATVGSINNESLRKKAQKRLDTVKANYDKLGKALKKASDKAQPFLSDLQDVQKALANDVTPDGLKSVRSVIDDANWNYKFVNSAMEDARKSMKKMEESLASQAQ